MAAETVQSYIGSYVRLRLIEVLMDNKERTMQDMELARRMVEHVKTLRKTLKKRLTTQQSSDRRCP